MIGAPTFARWLWPALSLLCGVVMGHMLTTVPPVPRTGAAKKPQSNPVITQSSTPLPAAPSTTVTSSDSAPAWPLAVTRQMRDPNYLKHAQMIWLPSECVERFRWYPGTIAEGCKLSPAAKSILDLDEAETVRVERAVDQFVAGIREIERRNSSILEKTATTVKVRVPSGLTANGPKQQLEAELLPILGPTGMHSLCARLTDFLRTTSAVISGQQFEIRSTLLDGDRMETLILRGSIGRDTSNVFPQHHAHLLPPIVGTGDSRQWE